jgi:hypothetical protein
MSAEETREAAPSLPATFDQLRTKIAGRDDETLDLGVQEIGTDTVLTHVVTRIVPASVATELPAAPLGVLLLALSSIDGPRHVTVARTAAGVEAHVGTCASPDATASMSLVSLLRLLVSEPGYDVAQQLASQAITVTGDEALARALPTWLRLPA